MQLRTDRVSAREDERLQGREIVAELVTPTLKPIDAFLDGAKRFPLRVCDKRVGQISADVKQFVLDDAERFSHLIGEHVDRGVQGNGQTDVGVGLVDETIRFHAQI